MSKFSFAWSFHGLFSWSFFHGLFFLQGLFHRLFSWSFLMVFSHGLCCLFMVSLAWSLATPIRQGRPFITFTVELERQ